MKQLIKDYPNYYITSTGKVLSAYKKGEELAVRIGKQGYAYVNLYNENGRKTKKIHRLVAETFIPNPLNYPQINHKDGNKLNNRVENLEWCNASQNTRHAFENDLINLNTTLHKEAARNNGKLYGGRCGRKVIMMNVKSGFVRKCNSVVEVARLLNSTEHIVRNILKKNKCLNGYQIWYADTLATTMDGKSDK